jgi:trigger factor
MFALKIETKPRDDHQVTVIAEFDETALEKFKHQAARKISQEAKVPGFRPGKAPYDVIRRLYGEELIEKQAIELMVDEVYPQVIDEAKINPGGSGALEEIISSNPPKFSFVIPLASEVVLGDYRSLRKDYAAEVVTDEEVDTFMRRLQTSYATAEPVEHPAEKGDLVYTKVTGTLVKPAEGEDAEFIKETPTQVVIGDDTGDDAWPYKGFSAELVGLSANDDKTVTHSYKKDDANEDLRGKKLEFHIHVESIKALNLPDLDDNFAQSVGDFETLDILKADIRKRLEAGKKSDYDNHYFDELIDQIIEQSVIKYPPQMLQDEEGEILSSLQQDLAGQHLDLPTYLKMIEKDQKTFVEESVTPAAKKRLSRSLVMDEIAKAEKIELGKEELQNEFNQTLYEVQSTTDMRKLQRKMSNEKLANAIAVQAASRLLSRRTLEQLKAIATGQAAEKPAEATDEKAAASTEEKPKKKAKAAKKVS